MNFFGPFRSQCYLSLGIWVTSGTARLESSPVSNLALVNLTSDVKMFQNISENANSSQTETECGPLRCWVQSAYLSLTMFLHLPSLPGCSIHEDIANTLHAHIFNKILSLVCQSQVFVKFNFIRGFFSSIFSKCDLGFVSDIFPIFFPRIWLIHVHHLTETFTLRLKYESLYACR